LRLCIINIEKCWRKINKEEFVEVLSFAIEIIYGRGKFVVDFNMGTL
jgi:hypothetical protein